jgi:chitodextrinase
MRRTPVKVRRFAQAWRLASLLVLAAAPSFSTSFVRVADEALVDQAQAIAVVRVLAADDSVGVSGRTGPLTEYSVQVEQVLKGDLPDAMIRVRVLGGRAPHGMSLKIYGAPAFTAGERALLFLDPHGDGTYRLHHFFLGAFHEVVLGGQTLAVRNLSEVTELKVTAGGAAESEAQAGELARGFDPFVRWIEKRSAGIATTPDYLLGLASGAVRDALLKFTFIGGTPYRWAVFDGGGSATFRSNQAGQPGLTGGGAAEVAAALAAWTSDGGSNISYLYGGATSATGGLTTPDGVNSVLFDDPANLINSPFSCSSGGVLAIGGPWGDGGSSVHNGVTFNRIVEGDVVTNRGLCCFFSSTSGSTSAAELFTHELGHTLGLGHSCGDGASPACGGSSVLNQATMRAVLHGDGRGAALGTDDQAAVACIYGAGCGSGPTTSATTPGGSASTFTPAPLPWSAGLAGVALGGPSADVFWSDLSMASAKASCGGGGTIPNAPTSLSATALSSSQVQLAWTDNASDETGYRVEVKPPGGAYSDVGGVTTNSTGAQVSGLTAVTTYSFRVRASGTGGFSAYSNEASATTMSSGGTAPTAPSNLLAATLSSTSVQLNWLDNSSNETGFRIEVKPSGGTYADIGGVATGSTASTVSGLSPSTTYFFRVRASGASGPSAYTNEVSATTLSSGGGNCTPDAHSFCLDGGRFRVTTTFRTSPTGPTSQGNVVPGGTADSGLFWFFAPANWEVMVKVLNGCGVNNRHWVFLAAATNVEYTVTVTDTATQAQKSYHNSLGSIAPVTTDVDAFASCQAPSTAAGNSSAGGAAPFVDGSPAPAAVEELGAGDDVIAPLLPGCTSDSHTFCLDGGRFRASITFRSASTGPATTGNVVPGSTADSGLFWFFAPSNWELMVKVLNGCAANNHHWVFLAGATNVEFTLTVTDTVTQAQKTYHNNLGAVPPVTTDTSAFPCQ